MGFLEEKRPILGLNQDDEDRVLESNEYRFALNVRTGSSDDNNVGAVENIKGNTLVEFTLPSGINTVRGEYEDEANQAMYYFVHNSSGNHQILKYSPDTNKIEPILASSLLNLNSGQIVHNINLIEGLLYWSDTINPPRKINVEKAKTNKQRQANVYFGVNEDDLWAKSTSILYQFKLTNPDGDVVFDQSIGGVIVFKENLAGGSKNMAKELNGLQQFRNQAVATSCGNFIEIEFKNEGGFNISVTALAVDSESIIVPQNYYSEITQQVLDVAKHTPRCAPTARIVDDSTRNINYLLDKTFQFAVGYIYDDNEKTPFSPYSELIFISRDNRTVPIGRSNRIEIDFSDERLHNGLIKKVELFVREGNISSWKSITVLEQHQFGIDSNIFNFYNDGSYGTIADEIALKHFDAVPLLANAQELAKSRMFYSNTLEGYDSTCVDASLDVAYNKPNEELETFTIKGTIQIRSPFVGVGTDSGKGSAFHQPIHNQGDGDGIVYGGFGTLNVDNNIARFGQTLELGGFVPYLAGTDHYTISEQRVVDSSIQGAKGVFNSDKGSKKRTIRGHMRLKDPTVEEVEASISIFEVPLTRVWSEFTIENVPKGRYVLRVASNLTTEADLNSTTRSYQKTSANVIRIKRQETAPTANIKEIEIVVDKDIEGIKIEIADLSNPVPLLGVRIVTGTVVDKDKPSLKNDIEALQDQRIEYAEIGLKTPSNVFRGNTVLGDMAIEWASKRVFSDHNGHFFIADITFDLARLILNKVTVQGIDMQASFFLADGSQYQNTGTGQDLFQIIARAGVTGSLDTVRTVLEGTVVDVNTGDGIESISVIASEGDVAQTRSGGEFEVVVYGNSKTGAKTRTGNLIFSDDIIQRLAAVPMGTISLGTLLGQFNFENPKPFGSITVISFVLLGTNAMKRGWDGQFGIVYFDRANRQDVANTSDDIILKIPFYTEPDPDTGNINPFGSPIISWQIKHEPPPWATHYQWVRTKNLGINSYIQWVIDTVRFIDENNVNTTVEQSTKISIGIIASLAKFNTNNEDSTVSFTPEVGWRVRFIKDEGNQFFTTYIDEKIVGATGDIIVKFRSELANLEPGTLIEVYDPKLQSNIKQYFEIDECYRIGINEVGRRVHLGSSQNQIFKGNGDLEQPATGIFKTGDAYYRQRQIPLEGQGDKIVSIDDASVSDFFISNFQSIGRLQIENPDSRQIRRNTIIRFGGRLLPETNVNNLSSFDGLDAQQLPKEYGDVNKLVLAENVLIAIHEFRWVSIYIEEALLRKQSGSNEIIATTDIIGSFRALKGKTGTINPESVDEYKGHIWAYDMNKGAIFRYSINGLEEVSQNKMKNFFLDTSIDLIRLENAKTKNVLGKYDPDNDELIIAFEEVKEEVAIPEDVLIFDGGDTGPSEQAGGVGGIVLSDVSGGLGGGGTAAAPTQVVELDVPLGLETVGFVAAEQVGTTLKVAQTIAFSERLIRWTSFYSFLPESISRVGLKLLTFKDGKLWIHEDNDIRNNFYGTQFTSKMEVISSMFTGKVKIFQAVSIESNDPWFAEKISTPSGQTSEIVKERFREKEGVFYADILRDSNSPGFANQDTALLNGAAMRGHSANFLMVNDNTAETVLYAINIMLISSERSKK